MPRRKSSEQLDLVLVVDSGATHTRAVVATTEGTVLGRGDSGPGNSYAVGTRLALANLHHAASAALRSARSRANDIAVVVVGSASVSLDGRGASQIRSELRSVFSKSRLLVVDDARIAIEGALAGGPGVVIVCGTGSIILAKSAEGNLIRVGGWGPLIGDEGSAQWVGREAVRRSAHAADGTGRKTALLPLVCRYFGLPSLDGVIDVIYGKAVTSAEWGRLAPLVTRAATAGDIVAREILREGASQVATQAASAVRRIGPASARVSFQGSMFRIGALFLSPLRARLKALVPGARLVAPMLSPLGGAFLMALADSGVPVTAANLARYRIVFRA